VQLAHVLVRCGQTFANGVTDGAASLSDPSLRAADDLVDGAAQVINRALGALAGSDGSVDGTFYRVSEGVRDVARLGHAGVSLGAVGNSWPASTARRIVLPLAARTIHLHPTAELAERVLLPGDPGRALAVATAVLDQPRMFNHARGLWGYSGTASDGKPLTIQATGMGGPSAAIVIEELIDLGARTLIRIGTCGALDPELELGRLVVAERVLARDGTSTALGASGVLRPDPTLTAALGDAGARPVTAVSTDLFYGDRASRNDEWSAAGVNVVEMEAATLLAVADRRSASAGIALAVSDRLAGGVRCRIEREGLEQAGVELGQLALAALARA